MLKTRIRRLSHQRDSTAERLTAIEASIVALDDEDLLDLADIFRARAETPLALIAASEMTRRGLRL
ncbi:hypothetical protein BW41_02034 [Sphingomonas sp. RIT328]|nr:hypothetical protein BW41_02034 [Sphingomonas sp. RIT328]